MEKNNNKVNLMIGLLMVAVIFFLFIFAFGFVAGKHLTMQNIVAYIILSFILGGLATGLLLLRLKIGLAFFILGLVIGFVLLYGNLVRGATGWEDLVGIFSFFTWTAIGLGAGLLIELIWFLYRKLRKGK